MNAEQAFIVVLIGVNLAVGLGFAVPIAGVLREATGKEKHGFRYVVILVGVYFVECVAFSAGMCTQVFSVGLALIWGVVLGSWLRKCSSAEKVLKSALLWSIYGSGPTVSFSVLFLLGSLLSGGNVLSSHVGRNFGIPGFVPWPLNTVLGFCIALGIGTVALKTVITIGEVGLLVHLSEKSATNSRRQADR